MVKGKGGGVDSEDEDEIKRRRELIREWFHYMGVYVVGDAVPFQGWLDLGGHEKPIKTITSGLDSVFGKILDEHRQKRASAVSSSDTTTVMLTWTLSLLLNNPGALKKAKGELELHVGDRQVIESDIKDLVYL
ncbi:cytochrome P450 CYP82D47-like protein [Tanacetum coccineum]